MTFQEERPYIGNLSQLFNVKEYRLSGGRQDGVRAVDICTGCGMELTVLPDRAMDLYQLKFAGKNLCYHTSSGIVAPTYYDADGSQWLRSFFGGFLTTCGLTNTGSASVDEGEALGVHGRIGNLPADRFAVVMGEENGNPQVTLIGVMNESVLFGHCLTLTRQIVCTYGSPVIRLTDTVENIGPRTVPHLMLYHFNMGYPLLSEKASYHIPSRKATGCTQLAIDDIAAWNRIDPPQKDFTERCYYHDLIADETGRTEVGVDNPAEDLRVRIRFNKNELPYFIQWRMLGEREYVTGLEPANAPIEGRAAARAEGALPFLEPGEKRTFHLEIEPGHCR